MVAILVLAVGVLGAVATAAAVLRLMAGGAQHSLAAHAAQSRFEWLRARPCAPVGGVEEIRSIREAWTVTAVDRTTFDVTDVVTYPTRNGVRTQTFRSLVRCLR
jgi:Tfp pilus assembly protein PilV